VQAAAAGRPPIFTKRRETVPRSLSIIDRLKRRPLTFALLPAIAAPAVAAIWVAPATQDRAPAAPAAIRPTLIGVNVGGITYYSGERAFMNLAQGSAWGVQRPGIVGSQPLDPSRFDEYGVLTSLQPGEVAAKMLVPPEGAYGNDTVRIRCVWQGQGSLRPGISARGIYPGRNRVEFDWPPAREHKPQPVNISLSEINPDDPVRRIDCRERNASQEDIFSPQFLALLSGFKLLRFMEWQNANANAPVTWATRPRPEGDNQSGKTGVAVEHMVALANAVGADAWFAMPWNADEDYMRRFATYVRDHLAPGRKVYVEVGNEVWNWGFRMTAQARDEGLAEGLATDPTQALLRRYAEKSAWMFRIWSDVFKATPNRLVRVMAFQNGNAWGMEQALKFRDTAQHVDAVASAPYFGYGAFKGDRATITDPNAVFAYLDADIGTTLANAGKLKDAAARYGKRYIAYEGGQHLVNADNVELLAQLNRDPRMHDLYRKYLTGWRNRIGDALVLYNSHSTISRFGAFGLREYPGQPLDETPKRRAVIEFLKAASDSPAPHE
jgi:hypothetical protein